MPTLAEPATTRFQALRHDGDDGELVLQVVHRGGAFSQPLPRSGSVLVGRARDADVRVDDPAISRAHARIHVGPLRIEDLGSANGVRVRGERLARGEIAPLEPGVAIDLGNVMLVVQRAPSATRPRRVWSHGYFEGRVEEECARAARKSASFAIARVHLAEGSPESAAAEIVSSVLRPADVLATYVPLELEALLIDATRADAERVVGRVVHALSQRGVAARAGIACFPDDARSPDDLVAFACDAVHKPKRSVRAGPHAVYGSGLVQLEPVLERIARGNINVLVTGETGVGKELVAELLHQLSPRAGRPLVRLNCAALSESLLASELFGHERGAFTGADRAKPGLLEAADGGTVFLDEVGELPLGIQPKLLRVLEDKEVVRVGALKGRPVDVRFVAATNRDLEHEIERGRFRQDLYFRLDAFEVHVPPLRERPRDVAEIARGFLGGAAKRAGVRSPSIAPEAMALLEAYSWPGNVRELRNVIERAVLLSTDGVIRPEHLPVDKMSQRVTGGSASSRPPPALDPLRAALEARDKQRLVDALAECGGNQTRAAKLLGISRGTLLGRMDACGLARPRKRR